MQTEFNPNRYAVIREKNKREIVMLRGSGCSWRRCRFCDYHLDSSPDEAANFTLNKQQLDRVTGLFGKLEVINSGSFPQLDGETMARIEAVCAAKGITEVHFECHWRDRQHIPPLRQRFGARGVAVKVKLGVETFDEPFRESYLDKGMPGVTPEEMTPWFDECCLLFGLPGQTAASMEEDLCTGLGYFERVCVNIMQQNGCPVRPDPGVIRVFERELLPRYRENERVDILMENTAFGVGGVVTGVQ